MIAFASVAFILIFCRFDIIEAIQFRGFKTLPNSRGTSSITDTFDVSSITECSVRCGITPNCFAVNWKDYVCELLEVPAGTHLAAVVATAWTYMCKLM